MSESNTLRFGLVGAGAIAQTYAQAFSGSDKVELVAVADTRIEAAIAMAEASECAAFESAAAMADEMDLEAVVVCTPPATHREVCKIFIERKIPVLCEKPLSIDKDTAVDILSMAKAHGVLVTMASKFRFVEDVAQAKALIESGVIGEVVLFENTFAGRVDMKNRWNSNSEVSGGGVLIDNGTHSVDITRYFLGALSEVQVMEGNRVQDLSVEDTVKMFIRSHKGVLGSVDLSWSMNKEQPYFIAVYGSAGTLLVGWKESKYRRSQDEEWTVFGSGYDKKAAFVRQLENFVGAINGQEQLLVSPADALASVEVIEAAYLALDKQDWHPVSDHHSNMMLGA